jgi:hypothetical protein
MNCLIIGYSNLLSWLRLQPTLLNWWSQQPVEERLLLLSRDEQILSELSNIY